MYHISLLKVYIIIILLELIYYTQNNYGSFNSYIYTIYMLLSSVFTIKKKLAEALLRILNITSFINL